MRQLRQHCREPAGIADRRWSDGTAVEGRNNDRLTSTAAANVEPAVFEMVMYHHDRHDGSGYPHDIQGSTIPPMGRIAGIVDCYDAMTTRTSYSPALAAYDAAREMNEMRDKQFSAEVVEQFLHTIGMFPTGSVIELSDGSAGLVLEQNPGNLLQPKVLVLKTPAGEMINKPTVINSQDTIHTLRCTLTP